MFRRTTLVVSLALASTGCASIRAKPAFGAFGLELSAGDHSVRPGDDFDRYASGHWAQTVVLKPDQPGWSNFDALIEASDRRCHDLVTELQFRTDLPAGSPAQQVRDFYASYLDITRRNAKGLEPLRPLLARYASIQSLDELIRAFGTAQVDGGNAPIGVGVSIDRTDPTRSLVFVDVSGLGLPDRQYYLDDDPRFAAIRVAYAAHIARMLSFAEIAEAPKRASELIALETALARVLWPVAERRDPKRTTNVIPYAELRQRHPDFDWDALVLAQGLAVPARINVVMPSAVGPVIALIRQTPLATWQTWLTYHAINGNAGTLSADIDEASFDFYGRVLEGQPEPQPPWQRAMGWMSERWGLGDELGQLYVARHFSPHARTLMQAMIAELRRAMRENLERADWLGPDTRAAAVRKLQKLRAKVGFPDTWRDFSSVPIVADDLFANARALRKYRVDDLRTRAERPTHLDEWRMAPQIPNSYHFAPLLEVVFPAAILQPPLFDPASDPAVNFGAIGAFIGHEFGHAFDDQGSKVDEAGVLRNWWSPADRERYVEKTRQLAAQLSTYCPLPGRCVDPELTMGETIGDLAGLSTAYTAYQHTLGGRPAPLLEGLTGDQRFFLSFAQMWRTLKRDDAVLRQLSDDPHPPAKYRINGALRNFGPWYTAFDVRPGDALFLEPELRVRLW